MKPAILCCSEEFFLEEISGKFPGERIAAYLPDPEDGEEGIRTALNDLYNYILNGGAENDLFHILEGSESP